MRACTYVRVCVCVHFHSMSTSRPARRQQLAIAKTTSSGSCFIEALLLHDLELNPCTHRVSVQAIQQIRLVTDIPKKMGTYLNGNAQQAVADHLDLSYVIVDVQRRRAALYVANGKHRTACRYAVLVQSTPQHVDVVMPRSACRCAPLSFSDLAEFLTSQKIELATSCSEGTVDLTL